MSLLQNQAAMDSPRRQYSHNRCRACSKRKFQNSGRRSVEQRCYRQTDDDDERSHRESHVFGQLDHRRYQQWRRGHVCERHLAQLVIHNIVLRLSASHSVCAFCRSSFGHRPVFWPDARQRDPTDAAFDAVFSLAHTTRSVDLLLFGV